LLNSPYLKKFIEVTLHVGIYLTHSHPVKGVGFNVSNTFRLLSDYKRSDSRSQSCLETIAIMIYNKSHEHKALTSSERKLLEDCASFDVGSYYSDFEEYQGVLKSFESESDADEVYNSLKEILSNVNSKLNALTELHLKCVSYLACPDLQQSQKDFFCFFADFAKKLQFIDTFAEPKEDSSKITENAKLNNEINEYVVNTRKAQLNDAKRKHEDAMAYLNEAHSDVKRAEEEVTRLSL